MIKQTLTKQDKIKKKIKKKLEFYRLYCKHLIANFFCFLYFVKPKNIRFTINNLKTFLYFCEKKKRFYFICIAK